MSRHVKAHANSKGQPISGLDHMKESSSVAVTSNLKDMTFSKFPEKQN